MCEKAKLRKKFMDLRMNMTAEAVQIQSHQICQNIINLPAYQSSKNILLYSAIKNEVDLSELFSHAINAGKIVYFPKVSGNEMDFYQIESVMQLKQGAFGVYEPIGDTNKIDTESAICFVPGLVFSTQFNRIGYGKGYYDKYLIEHANLKAYGIGYSFQINQHFDADTYDVPLIDVISC